MNRRNRSSCKFTPATNHDLAPVVNGQNPMSRPAIRYELRQAAKLHIAKHYAGVGRSGRPAFDPSFPRRARRAVERNLVKAWYRNIIEQHGVRPKVVSVIER